MSLEDHQEILPDSNLLKLRIDDAPSDSISAADHSVTIRVNTRPNTPTITPLFDDKEFPSIIIPPPQLDNYNTINSNYISNLSLSSVPNTPYLGNNLSLSSAPSTNKGFPCICIPTNAPQLGHYQESTNSNEYSTLSNVALELSETCLTPNMAATDCNTCKIPNSLILNNEDDFSLDSMHTSLEQKMNDHDMDTDKIVFLNPKKMRGIPENESLKTLQHIDVDIGTEHQEEKMCMVDDEEMSHTIIVDEILMDAEQILFQKRGYKMGKKLATTLQGGIFELERVKDGQQFVLKKTDKYLHKRGITIQDGKRFSVKEDILKEKSILEQLTKRNAPNFMVRFIDFFESDDYYYLVC